MVLERNSLAGVSVIVWNTYIICLCACVILNWKNEEKKIWEIDWSGYNVCFFFLENKLRSERDILEQARIEKKDDRENAVWTRIEIEVNNLIYMVRFCRNAERST